MKKQTSTATIKGGKGQKQTPLPVVRSKFYAWDRRMPIIQGRVVGLNLQGHAQPKKAFFFSLSREVKTTIFILEISIANIRWTLSKSFEELKQFYALLRTDESLLRGRDLLTANFPQGDDGEDDVMLLVERREMIEGFLKETLCVLDPEIYAPLALFLDSPPHFDHVRRQVKKVARYLRSMPSKKKLLMRLFEFYSKDLMDFVVRLENGISVYNIDDRFAGEDPFELHNQHMLNNVHTSSSTNKNSTDNIRVESVLWLDVCEEPGLSRLCLAPRSIFSLPDEDIYEDARLANGIFLSDIAEIRPGATSEAFRRQCMLSNYQQKRHRRTDNSANSTTNGSNNNSSSGANKWYDASQCLSVIGSERTLAFQLIPPTTATNSATTVVTDDDGRRTNVQSTTSNTNSDDAAQQKQQQQQRSQFVELLNLLALQSLSSEDVFQRRRRFQKLHVHASLQTSCQPVSSPLFLSTHHLDASQVEKDASSTEALLAKGIEVEEEVVSPDFGVQIVTKMMRYDVRRRCLWITSLLHHEEEHRLRLEEEFDALHNHHQNSDGYSDECSDSGSSDCRNSDHETSSSNQQQGTSEREREQGGYEDDTEEEETSSGSVGRKHHHNSRHRDENALFAGSTTSSGGVDPPSSSLFAAHHQHHWQLTSSASRYLHVDDIAEVRPGRVSSFVDHPEQDACVLSIIGSATIVVLPVPSLSLRDKLVRRFQHFFFVQRHFDEMMANDTTPFFQPRPPRIPRTLVSSKREEDEEEEFNNGISSNRDSNLNQNGSRGDSEGSRTEDKDTFFLPESHENNSLKQQHSTTSSSSSSSSLTRSLLSQSLSPPHTPLTRYSDTQIHQTPIANPSPTVLLPDEDASNTKRDKHHRRHSHSHSHSQHRAPRRHSYDQAPSAFTSPIPINASMINAGTSLVSPTVLSTSLSAFQTPPVAGRSTSNTGIFSHGRQARSVTAVRRSSTSTSAKGKSSLTDAFSFT